MEEIQKDQHFMGLKQRIKFDESKLTPRQLRAYQIANSQGTKSIDSFDEILMDVDPEIMQHLFNTIMKMRREERNTRQKNPLSND